jgi:hypothetical protein
MQRGVWRNDCALVCPSEKAGAMAAASPAASLMRRFVIKSISTKVTVSFEVTAAEGFAMPVRRLPGSPLKVATPKTVKFSLGPACRDS